MSSLLTVTVTLTMITTDAGLLSCSCMADGNGKLRSSFSHESFIGVFDIVYKLWVKATSKNSRGREK